MSTATSLRLSEPAKTKSPVPKAAVRGEKSSSSPGLPMPVLQLKKSCVCDGSCPRCLPPVQTRLNLGTPNDPYETEADRIAVAVTQLPAPGPMEISRLMRAPAATTGALQRQVSQPDSCSSTESGVGSDEEEQIQARQNDTDRREIHADLAHKIQSLRGSGQPLSPMARSFFEPRLGADLSGVRIHTNAAAGEATRSLNAQAFTIGCDIAFAAGHYSDRTRAGQLLLGHELTHVIQQGAAKMMDHQQVQRMQKNTGEYQTESTAVQSPGVQVSHLGKSGIIQRQVAPATMTRELEEEKKALKAEAKKAALTISEILQDTSFLGSLSSEKQSRIMTLLHSWAQNKTATGSRLTPLDLLIVALRQQTFEVGITHQSTSAFDRLFHLLNQENKDQLQELIKAHANVFKDEKAIELAKFEVSKEQILGALELSAELAAAIATGGGSVLVQILTWLAKTFPKLFQQVMAVLDFVKTIRNIKISDIKKMFSPAGIGDLLVKALFGEQTGLPAADVAEEKEEKSDSGAAPEAKGLARVFQILVRVFEGLKKVYNKVAGAVGKVLTFLNITIKPWFPNFSMIYAAIFKALEAITDPKAVLNQAVTKIKDAVSDFFKQIKEKISETGGKIKSTIELIGKPAQLVHILADKAVEMVLNFIISNPPSALIKLAFKAIETGTGKSIIELVRQHIPFADKLINRIAESETMQTLLAPIKPPVDAVAGFVGRIEEETQGVVTGVEGKVNGLLANGTQFMSELTGLNIEAAPATAGQPAPPAAQPSRQSGGGPAADFFSVIKQGIHSRLIRIGEENLVAKGKELGKAALEKGKEAVTSGYRKMKGLILGSKANYEVNGEPHEFWFEEIDGKIVGITASEQEISLDEAIPKYLTQAESIQGTDTQKYFKTHVEELDKKYKIAKQMHKDKVSKNNEIKQELAKLIEQISALLPTAKTSNPLTDFKLPSGARLHVTKEWKFLVCNGQCVEIDSYINHRKKVTGSHLHVHHLLEKRFLEPLNKLRRRLGSGPNQTNDSDEMNAAILPGSPGLIKYLVELDPAAEVLKGTNLFHARLKESDDVHSISMQLINEKEGIAQNQEDELEKGPDTSRKKFAQGVFDKHKGIYEKHNKKSWVEAIKMYFRGIIDGI